MDKLAFEKAVALADELVENNEVRLQIELASAALRAKNGPAAFYEKQAEVALERYDVNSDEVVPDADKWLDKKTAYYNAIFSKLDRIIMNRLEKEHLDYSTADLAALRIMITTRVFERAKQARTK